MEAVAPAASRARATEDSSVSHEQLEPKPKALLLELLKTIRGEP